MPATAQNHNRAPREAVVERLASIYGESRQSIGLAEQRVVRTRRARFWSIYRKLPGMPLIVRCRFAWRISETTI